MKDAVFKLVRLLGSGAAGDVHLALDTQSSQKFALKVLKDLSPAALGHFEREVSLLSKLRHPGLVAIHGFSRSGHGFTTPHFWMEWIDGHPIDAMKEASPEAVASWLRETLAALDYLHTEGLLHGDIKPANLLIDADRHARLVDFGLASLVSAKDAKLRGSLPYLAPEAVRGERTPASDLYALGTIFYERLVGRRPRGDARNLEELFAPDFPRLESLNAALPPRMARVIDRMLEIDPAIRFKSARDVLAALSENAPLPPEAYGKGGEPFRMRGRDREWSQATAFVEKRGEKGGIILVSGLTGTGKTRFARELYFHIALMGLNAAQRASAATPPAAERREYFERLGATDERRSRSFLIVEIDEDRISQDGKRFFDSLAEEEGVTRVVLSPEGFQDSARLSRSDFQNVLKVRLAKLETKDLRILNSVLASDGPASSSDAGAVAGVSPVEAARSIRHLVDAGLLRRSGGEGERYEAPHPSLSAIAAERLGNREMVSLHRRWLERERFCGDTAVFAHHALAVETLTATPLSERTLQWTLDAISRLELSGDCARAVRLARTALALPPADDATGASQDALLRALANVLGTQGDFPASIDVLEEWFSVFPQGPEGINPVKYGLATGVAFKNLGRTADAHEHLNFALTSADPNRESHRPRMARAHALLGQLDLDDGRTDDARSHFEAARGLLLDAGEQKAEVFLLEARLETSLGRWTQAQQALDESEAVAVQIDSRPARFAVALERGNLALKLDRLEDARASYDAALAIASDPRDEALLARVHQNRGVLEGRADDPAAALAELKRAHGLLLFFGGDLERGLNHLQRALTHAELGQLETARRLLREAPPLTHPEFTLRRSEVEAQIASIERGETGEAGGDAEAARARLESIHRSLPDALKISFEDRPDYQRLAAQRQLDGAPSKETPMDILNRLGAIMRDLLTSDDVDGIMTRVLDGALEISKAERGFLVARDEEVKAARNLSKDFLKGNEFKMSLTAAREVIRKGEALVTDNAAIDPRFKTAASVQEMDLKSICVLPLKTAEGVIGVLYLDQPYQAQVFKGADLNVLQMFADQAALALQKAQAIGEMKQEIVTLKKEVEEQRLQLTHEYAEIVGQSRPMMDVLSLVDRLIDTSIPVWIYGESGTGKEAIARALHFKGPRARKAFVSENCSSLPEQLLESELFGHKRGSFTHADRDKKGLLHHADGGTVFLDEIADMSPTLQAKMLRFLQEGEIRPIGANEVIKVDVRVVSASNKDLNALVADGKFREDLFYRLNGMTVSLPPLRDRAEDIPLLVQHFLRKLALAEKKEPLEATPEALDLLMDYPWPGNVRELENTIRSAQLFHYKGKLLAKSFHFKKALFGQAPVSLPATPSAARPASVLPKTKVDERQLLLEALKKTNFHKGEAAEALGISRRYLYTQMEKFGIPTKRMAMKAYVEKELK